MCEGRNIIMDLLEKVLSRENLRMALQRVEENKGVGGVDGVSTEQLRDYLREHWQAIREKMEREPIDLHLFAESKSRNLTVV